MRDEIEEKDDLTILDTDRLFRRVPPNQWITFSDGTSRISSSLFKHERMSINIESLMIQQARRPEDTLQGYPTHYLTSIIAAEVRKFALPIVNDTDPPNDPAHGLILGKKKDSFANAMVRSHKWIVEPPKS